MVLALLKKKEEVTDLETYRDITDDVIESDFVPYACMFDPHTIVTKNGELLQTIKVVGFSYEAVAHEPVELRDTIRRAISAHIPTNEYAIWFHTLRRQRSLKMDGDFPDPFSQSVNDAWNEVNQWERTYVNELYVTIARECESASIGGTKGFVRGLIPNREIKERNAYLDRAFSELDKVCGDVLGTLKQYGAKRLGLVERDGVAYSENLEFLEKLINLEERAMPVPQEDLSEYLTSGEITFAYNAMEVRTYEGKRRFATILTIKEYKEASLEAIDRFMQTPCEFIVTQCFDFINAKEALSNYEEQKELTRISGDDELSDTTELTAILASNRHRPTDFGQQQTTLFIIAPSVKELEASVLQLREALSEIGIVSIREDIKFEECYWAQLPGNFEFVKRLRAINTQHVAGFANLNNFPAGSSQGSHWGPPVALFYTAAKTPYFFNFHHAETGHTSIIGPNGSGKSVLINFLVAQSRKFHPRIVYFDATHSAKHFLEAIGGQYHSVTQGDLTINPFLMPDTAANREFLSLWVATLIDSQGEHITQEMMQLFARVIEQMYTSPEIERSLSSLITLVGRENSDFAEKLSVWKTGAHSGWIHDTIDKIRLRHDVIGFDISEIIKRPDIRIPVVSYMLHRIGLTLTPERPTIIVLDEGFQILENPIFGPRLGHWMHYITKHNGIVITATEEIEAAAALHVTPSVLENSVTQIFMPNDFPSMEAYIARFQLSEEEFRYVGGMNKDERHFLLKRGNESIIGEMNLAGLDDIVRVLSGSGRATAEPASVDTTITSYQNTGHAGELFS